ncbi:hypothetical protein BD413DRAFT_233155 [Trametes elegans]|nr:hypothetical protein BD413DRAFT_233155 [Trametes elegans]
MPLNWRTIGATSSAASRGASRQIWPSKLVPYALLCHYDSLGACISGKPQTEGGPDVKSVFEGAGRSWSWSRLPPALPRLASRAILGFVLGEVACTRCGSQSQDAFPSGRRKGGEPLLELGGWSGGVWSPRLRNAERGRRYVRSVQTIEDLRPVRCLQVLSNQTFCRTVPQPSECVLSVALSGVLLDASTHA